MRAYADLLNGEVLIVMQDADELIYKRFITERNEEDFRILLERHKESLMLFLYSYVHNLEDAEELMLDTYAEVAAGSSFFGKSSFKTWLFSIGKNKALMRLRKRHFTTVELTEMAEKKNEPPEMEILSDERNRQLYKALDQIKEEYRQILILLYFEEMSYDEVERVMGKRRKQIYNLAERGRLALKERLERMGFDYA